MVGGAASVAASILSDILNIFDIRVGTGMGAGLDEGVIGKRKGNASSDAAMAWNMEWQ